MDSLSRLRISGEDNSDALQTTIINAITLDDTNVHIDCDPPDGCSLRTDRIAWPTRHFSQTTQIEFKPSLQLCPNFHGSLGVPPTNNLTDLVRILEPCAFSSLFFLTVFCL